MAKFDTYTLSVRIGDDKTNATLSLTVLFEDGDNTTSVIRASRNAVETEARAMKNDDFLKRIKQ